MIFSSPVLQKACTESPKGSRCMLFAGQVMKISCPPVVKRVINLPYDMITLLAENRQISINYNFNNPLLLSGQCDIEELLFRTGLIPLTQRFVYVSYIHISYKLIFLTAKYHLVKILCFIQLNSTQLNFICKSHMNTWNAPIKRQNINKRNTINYQKQANIK